MSLFVRERIFTPEAAEQFRRRGYLVLDDCLEPARIEQLRRSILDYAAAHETVRVERGGAQRSFFFTINGEDVGRAAPPLTAMYEELARQVSSLGCGKYVMLANRQIGLSVNIITRGGQFAMHFDRNALTAVLYLADVRGGTMELLPRARALGTAGRLRGFLQRLRLGLIKRTSFWSTSVAPKAGRMLIFEGNRTLHGVRPLAGDETACRISVQFAFDQPNVEFPVDASRDYYGYGAKAVQPELSVSGGSQR